MSDTLYVNKPGGAIVHLKDGSSEFKPYGSAIDPDHLAEHQHAHLDRVADGNKRQVSPEEADLQKRLQEAHNASVVGHGGQVYSSADVVPGDYGNLDEDGAIALMRSLENYPAAQAQVLLHERVNFGREAVIDAASDQARVEADFQLEQMEAQVLATHQRVATPVHKAAAEATSDEDDGPKKSWTKDRLLEYGDEHGYEGLSEDMTKDDIFEALSKPPESTPATPPPAS